MPDLAFDVLLILALLALLGTGVFVLMMPPAEATEPEPYDRTTGQGRGPGAALFVLLVASILLLLAGFPALIAVSGAVLIAIAVHVAMGTWAARRAISFELALAASIDLMVASLRAGAAIVDSIDSAASESPGETGVMLRSLRDRLKLGEPLAPVLDDVVLRYPQEGARMFAFTLGAHLDSGGSAATSLAEVARAIRDRVDVIRRANSQSAETQASVIGILAITYGLAFMMWNQYPDRVETFVSNDLGQAFIGLSILLQAAGLGWIWSITRVEV